MHVVVLKSSFEQQGIHSFQMHSFVVVVLLLLFTFDSIHAAKEVKPKVKKDPLDFTENDVNNLFEQWEVKYLANAEK